MRSNWGLGQRFPRIRRKYGTDQTGGGRKGSLSGTGRRLLYKRRNSERNVARGIAGAFWRRRAASASERFCSRAQRRTRTASSVRARAEEIRDLVKETGAKLVIFDNDLTPSQIKALESLTGASVLDRSALILDIFAQRAKTREGKLQVELAAVSVLSAAAYRLERDDGALGRRHRHQEARAKRSSKPTSGTSARAWRSSGRSFWRCGRCAACSAGSG